MRKTISLREAAFLNILSVVDMARASYRKIAIPLLFTLILPLTAMLCCCVGEVAVAALSTQTHSREATGHHHGDHHHGQSDPSHDHGQCDHNQLLSPVIINQAIQFVKPTSQTFNFQEKPLVLKEVSLAVPLSGSPPLETGPPGAGLRAIPLYLEISVLRI